MQRIPPKIAFAGGRDVTTPGAHAHFYRSTDTSYSSTQTATQLRIKGIPAKYWSALLLNCNPSQSQHEDFDQHPRTTNASLTAAIQNPHRPVTSDQTTSAVWIHSSSRPLTPLDQLLCCVHERCVPPNQPRVAANQLHGPIIPTEGSGQSQ